MSKNTILSAVVGDNAVVYGVFLSYDDAEALMRDLYKNRYFVNLYIDEVEISESVIRELYEEISK